MNWQSVQAVHAMLIRRQGVTFGVLVILGDSLEVHESELVCVPALCDDFAPLVQCQGLMRILAFSVVHSLHLFVAGL